MRLECDECGYVLDVRAPLSVCPQCGTAGACFIDTEETQSVPEVGSNMTEHWFQAGLRGQTELSRYR